MSGNAALLWNGLDGLINSKPFMPTASPRQQAVALMELAERDGECLGNGERRLVIRFAEAVRDYRKSDREKGGFTVKKKDLLRMRRLKATSKMVKNAKRDIPQKVMFNTYWGPCEGTCRKYQLYLRCCVEGGILKTALYYPDNLRAGGRLPSYEVFIDRDARHFATFH